MKDSIWTVNKPNTSPRVYLKKEVSPDLSVVVFMTSGRWHFKISGRVGKAPYDQYSIRSKESPNTRVKRGYKNLSTAKKKALDYRYKFFDQVEEEENKKLEEETQIDEYVDDYVKSMTNSVPTLVERDYLPKDNTLESLVPRPIHKEEVHNKIIRNLSITEEEAVAYFPEITNESSKDVLRSLSRRYNLILSKQEYLSNCFEVFRRLYSIIEELPYSKQLQIVEAATSIAYSARISAYDQLNSESGVIPFVPTTKTNNDD